MKPILVLCHGTTPGYTFDKLRWFYDACDFLQDSNLSVDDDCFDILSMTLEASVANFLRVLTNNWAASLAEYRSVSLYRIEA